MATFRVQLDKRRQLHDGTYPLIIRIYSGAQRRDINLKTRLKETEFDESIQKVIGKHPNRKLINHKIQQAVLQVQQTTLNLEIAHEVVTTEKIKSLIVRPQPKLNFIQYGEKIVEEMKAVSRVGNAAAYRDALSALKTYSGKTDLQFKDLNYELLNALENKMLAAGLKRNSIAAYNRSLRAIFNRAIKEELVEVKFYPYRHYKIKGEGTAKRNITKEDIVTIANLKLEPESQAWHARNYFLLSFNLRGISFTDMLTIKPSDITNGRLIYKRKKTHKLYNIKLTEKAQEILNYYKQPDRAYILPSVPEQVVGNAEEERKAIHQAIKTSNYYLKKIGEDMKLQQQLTTYVSRHSWACCAKRMGYSKDLISEALGHAYGNRITEIYLDSYDMEVIDAMNEQVCRF